MDKSNKKPDRTVLKAILIAAVAILLIPCLLFGGILCWAWITDINSNRIAKRIIDPKAAEYIAQTYPDNDFLIKNSYYVFKDNCYRVNVQSQASQDTHFYIDYHYKSYELIQDTYESNVTSGGNTFIRIEDNYSALVQECLSSASCLQSVASGFCRYSENTDTHELWSPKGLDRNTLILDKHYDVGALGASYGYLKVTAVLPKEKVNIDSALELLTEIDQLLTDSNIGYYVIEITIVDAVYPDTTAEFKLYGVHPEDLYREDSLAYLQDLWAAQEAHRQAIADKWNN